MNFKHITELKEDDIEDRLIIKYKHDDDDEPFIGVLDYNRIEDLYGVYWVSQNVGLMYQPDENNDDDYKSGFNKEGWTKEEFITAIMQPLKSSYEVEMFLMLYGANIKIDLFKEIHKNLLEE